MRTHGNTVTSEVFCRYLLGQFKIPLSRQSGCTFKNLASSFPLPNCHFMTHAGGWAKPRKKMTKKKLNITSGYEMNYARIGRPQSLRLRFRCWRAEKCVRGAVDLRIPTNTHGMENKCIVLDSFYQILMTHICLQKKKELNIFGGRLKRA